MKKINLPQRNAYGNTEIAMLQKVLNYYNELNEDPGYQGYFENLFCEKFSSYMGGGFADAVATGTASVYVALAALDLPKGSEILISPVTDSGPLNCIILQGYSPVLMDSKKGSFNIDCEQFLKKITSNTKAAIIMHIGGEPIEDIEEIVHEAKKRNIKIIEDCSQATGGSVNNIKVGNFGDIAAFSTMYRKNLIAGSCGGIVFTKNKELYHLAMAHADRGKPVWRRDINLNNPGYASFPALNFNTDELSCAVGIASLERLDITIEKRKNFLKYFIKLLTKHSKICTPSSFGDNFSPFFYPVFVNTKDIKISKTEFALELKKRGVGNNEHYGCIISSWEWAKKYFKYGFSTPNAENMRDTSFNLFLNENYNKKNAEEIVDIIVETEKIFMK